MTRAALTRSIRVLTFLALGADFDFPARALRLNLRTWLTPSTQPVTIAAGSSSTTRTCEYDLDHQPLQVRYSVRAGKRHAQAVDPLNLGGRSNLIDVLAEMDPQDAMRECRRRTRIAREQLREHQDRDRMAQSRESNGGGSESDSTGPRIGSPVDPQLHRALLGTRTAASARFRNPKAPASAPPPRCDIGPASRSYYERHWRKNRWRYVDEAADQPPTPRPRPPAHPPGSRGRRHVRKTPDQERARGRQIAFRSMSDDEKALAKPVFPRNQSESEKPRRHEVLAWRDAPTPLLRNIGPFNVWPESSASPRPHNCRVCRCPPCKEVLSTLVRGSVSPSVKVHFGPRPASAFRPGSALWDAHYKEQLRLAYGPRRRQQGNFWYRGRWHPDDDAELVVPHTLQSAGADGQVWSRVWRTHE